MKRLAKRLFFLAAVVAIASGCSADDSADAEVTYYGDIEQVITDNCAGCHHPDQGAPIDLHTYDALQHSAHASLTNMEQGQMPPWPPDSECREYHHQRVMPDEDIELFRQWIDLGMPAGERPDDWTPFQPEGHPQPDRRAAVPDAPYNPREDLDDEYRCFLLDETFDEHTYVTGVHVDTGGAEVIHHANIFLVNEFDEPTVEQLEAEHDDAGYPCYGDPGFSSIDLIGAWVPGAQPIFTPEDTSVIIPEGSRLVMQTHFNTIFAEPEPVEPEVLLYTRDAPPDQRVWGMPFAIMDLVIPPGESESVHTQTYQNRDDDPWQIIGVAPHLHDFATEVRVEAIHDDGSESCLVDIPTWDFNWQQAYRFLDGEAVEIDGGEQIRLTCVYDNSPQNQPIIDGERRDPETVTWGADTTDEMCMTFLMVLEDYDPSQQSEERCDLFADCRSDCDDPYSIDCIFDCGTLETDCGVCLLEGAQDCGNEYCPELVDDATPCLLQCGQEAQSGGSLSECLQDECPDTRDELENCMRPRIEAGHCNQYLDSCNIVF